MTFEQFFTELKSDEVWFTNATMYYKPETVQDVARDLFMACSADNSLNRPIGDMRRYFWNKLRKITPDKVRKPFVIKEEPEIKVVQPLTGEERQRRLREWEEMVRNSPLMKTSMRLSSQRFEDEGQVRPKPLPPYPASSLSEVQKHERHIAYLKYAYDPRTGDRIPGTVSEEEFNQTI